MPNYTPNYNLIKPLPTEYYSVGVFNDNADKIDTDLKSIEDSFATELGLVDEQIKNLAISVTNFSDMVPNKEESPSLWDWTLPIQHAINTSPTGTTIIIPRKASPYRTTSKISVNRPVELVMHGLIEAEHDDIALEIRGSGLGSSFIPNHRLSARKKTLDHTKANSVGIKIVNCYQSVFRIDYLKDFTTGLLMTADDEKGNVYNQISLGQLHNNKTQILITAQQSPGNKEWVNQNTFVGGRLYYGTTVNKTDCVQIKIEGGGQFYRSNGNTFTNTSLEDVGTSGVFAKAIFCNGWNNKFDNLRVEGSRVMELGEHSAYNQIESGTYVSFSYILDLGLNNQIQTRASGAIYNAQANGYLFKGAGATSPLKAYNSNVSEASIEVFNGNGNESRVKVRANGVWNVYGERKVLYGVYVASPSTGTWRRGDISFITNPSDGQPLGYKCVSSGSPGTWVPFGGRALTRQDSTATTVEALKNDFNDLLAKLRTAGLLKS